MKKLIRLGCVCLAVAVSGAPGSVSAEISEHEALRAEFVNPPKSSGPRTWWHWLSNNISREGITKDLEAMKAMGLKGT